MRESLGPRADFAVEVTVPNQASAAARAAESDVVGRLAKFFPEATPVRIPIRLSSCVRAEKTETNDAPSAGRTPASRWNPVQETVIEFGTPREVLFLTKQRLEFADVVLLESKDGALRAEASVVAVQYHPERTVVAARFLKYVPNWIVKS